MKRSNITLIALGVVATLLIAAIPVFYRQAITDAAKSRLGEAGYSKHRFPEPKVVKLVNMENVTVLAGDTLAIDFKSSEKGSSEFMQAGDTLFISGNGHLIVSVANQIVVAMNSTVLLKGDLRRFDAPSLSFALTNTSLYSLPISTDRRTAEHLYELRIMDNDGNSTIDLGGRFDIEHLFLHNVKRFTCSSEVNFFETDISFDNGGDVRSMTCREGIYIYH